MNFIMKFIPCLKSSKTCPGYGGPVARSILLHIRDEAVYNCNFALFQCDVSRGSEDTFKQFRVTNGSLYNAADFMSKHLTKLLRSLLASHL